MGHVSATQKLYARTCEKILPLRYIQQWAEAHNPFLFKRFNEVETSLQRRVAGAGVVDLPAVTIDCERLVSMLAQAVPYVDIPVSDEALQSVPEFDVPDLSSAHSGHGTPQWSSEIEVDGEWLEPDSMPEDPSASYPVGLNILASPF